MTAFGGFRTNAAAMSAMHTELMAKFEKELTDRATMARFRKTERALAIADSHCSVEHLQQVTRGTSKTNSHETAPSSHLPSTASRKPWTMPKLLPRNGVTDFSLSAIIATAATATRLGTFLLGTVYQQCGLSRPNAAFATGMVQSADILGEVATVGAQSGVKTGQCKAWQRA